MDKKQDKTVIHERRGASKKSPTIDQAYVLGGSYQDAVGSWGGRVNTEPGTELGRVCDLIIGEESSKIFKSVLPKIVGLH